MPVNPYDKARDDLAKVIAQQISGVEGVLPERDDYDLAEVLLYYIDDEKWRDANLRWFEHYRIVNGS